METLTVVGGGVAGRSLLYSLTKNPGRFKKIILFDDPQSFSPCSLNSTAIVAPRGVTSGHSELGDLLVEGFKTFSQHVNSDAPAGVAPIIQRTGTKLKIDQFKLRYPSGEMQGEHYFAEESAFVIHPPTYLDWLLREAKNKLPLEVINKPFLQDQDERIVFCGGVYNAYWGLVTSKSVQGSYLEFSHLDLGEPFSLTLDGLNAIYRNRELLIGSTSSEHLHVLAPLDDLKKIYQTLKSEADFDLPPFEHATVKVGLREKASKRMPYLKGDKTKSLIGGFYKNGFTLSLHMAQRWVRDFS